MKEFLAGLLACKMLVLFVFAENISPDRPAPPTAKSSSPKENDVPDFSGETYYGIFTQNGISITHAGVELESGEKWDAIGTVRKGGSLVVTWTDVNSGNIALGVYRVQGGSIVGSWGWADRCRIGESGELEGSFFEGDELRGASEDSPPLP